MMKTLLFPGITIIVAAAVVCGQSSGPQLSTQRVLIDQYCVGCHNDKAKTGGLDLTSLDLNRVQEGAPQWEKVVRKLRSGMMPPAGVKRPEAASVKTFVTTLEAALDQVALSKPNPGRT